MQVPEFQTPNLFLATPQGGRHGPNCYRAGILSNSYTQVWLVRVIDGQSSGRARTSQPWEENNIMKAPTIML